MDTPPKLQGIVPPLPTPLKPDGEVDVQSLRKLVENLIEAGVHGLWVLGTTARFDLLTDAQGRLVAETVAEAARGRVPLVLNVSDMGTRRTLQRSARFDDLHYDYYAALPPWYNPLTEAEVDDYFRALADGLARPLVIYNAPWVCNQLGFGALRRLGSHPRIVGCKDVTPLLSRVVEWSASDRRSQEFAYLYGTDMIATGTNLGADGYVSATSNAFPEVAVAAWEAARAGDLEAAARHETRFLRLASALTIAPMHACLEAACRHRGFLDSMQPAPLRPLEPEEAARVAALIDAIGVLPDGSESKSPADA